MLVIGFCCGSMAGMSSTAQSLKRKGMPMRNVFYLGVEAIQSLLACEFAAKFNLVVFNMADHKIARYHGQLPGHSNTLLKLAGAGIVLSFACMLSAMLKDSYSGDPPNIFMLCGHGSYDMRC